ncbi:MAG: hypothetical protein IPM53_18385 [Anaerolineaceae bacterium]|nr:hypothetical protein [Anaerolineaceae bacterium]
MKPQTHFLGAFGQLQLFMNFVTGMMWELAIATNRASLHGKMADDQLRIERFDGDHATIRVTSALKAYQNNLFANGTRQFWRLVFGDRRPRK